MPDQNPFESLGDAGGDPNARGEPRTSARDIASAAAAEAIGNAADRGPTTASPGTQFRARDEEPLESETSQFAEFEDLDEPREGEEFYDDEYDEYEDEPGYDEYQESRPQHRTQRERDQAADQEAAAAEFEYLRDLGVDIPEDVPDNVHATLSDLEQAVMDHEQMVLEQSRDAQEAIMQVQALRDRLSTPEGQKRILLGMAMQNGDTFNDVVNTIQRMEEDPEFAKTIQRELEADIKLEEAKRREQAFTQTQMQEKAQRIQTRTRRVAQRFGIDPEFAEQQVANQILMNEARTGKRDISLSEVDEVLGNLASRMGRKRRRVKRPQQRERERKAPQKSTKRAASDRQPDDRDQPSRSRDGDADPSNLHSFVRNAVRQSSKNVRSKGL